MREGQELGVSGHTPCFFQSLHTIRHWLGGIDLSQACQEGPFLTGVDFKREETGSHLGSNQCCRHTLIEITTFNPNTNISTEKSGARDYEEGPPEKGPGKGRGGLGAARCVY